MIRVLLKVSLVFLTLVVFVAFIAAGLSMLPVLLGPLDGGAKIPKVTPSAVPQKSLSNWPDIIPRFFEPLIQSNYPLIILHKNNSIIFRNVVTRVSVSAAIGRLVSLSHKLSKNDNIYLFLDTPGGIVDDGEFLIDTVKALPQEVKTITQTSMSMGFHIVQSLGERLVLPSGMYMSHRMRGGVEGQIPGEAVTRLNAALTLATYLDTAVAKRIGISVDAYRHLIFNEYWVSGEEAVKNRIADRVVIVRCGKDLDGTFKDVMETPFGSVSFVWSECPLIHYPLSIDVGGNRDSRLREYIEMYLNDKYAFVWTYIVNGIGKINSSEN